MEHQTLEQIQRVAELHPDQPCSSPLSKRERLERWIELLEQTPHRRLNTLPGTEYQAPDSRDRMRCTNSVISVAYNDPVLRAEGLQDDTYDSARQFFGLSHRELHDVVCYCHHGATMTAQAAAWRLRATTATPDHSGLLVRAWRFLTGR